MIYYPILFAKSVYITSRYLLILNWNDNKLAHERKINCPDITWNLYRLWVCFEKQIYVRTSKHENQADCRRFCWHCYCILRKYTPISQISTFHMHLYAPLLENKIFFSLNIYLYVNNLSLYFYWLTTDDWRLTSAIKYL